VYDAVHMQILDTAEQLEQKVLEVSLGQHLLALDH
jgi:hypothetical protein